MGLFDDALANARDALKVTFGRPMTFIAMAASEPGGTKIKPLGPDQTRQPLDLTGVLHEFALGRRGQSEVIERTDGGRPGGRFGVDLSAGTTRVSVDIADLGGWSPPVGTQVSVPPLPTDAVQIVRLFEIVQPLPTNGGRQAFYVSEITGVTTS